MLMRALLRAHNYHACVYTRTYARVHTLTHTGHAKFTGPNTIEVDGKDGKRVLNFDKAMIATGGSAWVPPG